MTKFKKGDSVIYRQFLTGRRYRAIILNVKKGGHVTVKAMFQIDQAGADVGSFIGYTYKMRTRDLWEAQ